MSMVLNNQKLIRGISSQTAKKICTFCHGYPQSLQDIASFLSVTETTAMNWAIALSESGYLDVEAEEEQILWLCSSKGYTELATARFGGNPLSGSEFSRLLTTIIQRAKEYNECEVYPLYIDKVYVFGSVLSQPWQVEDPNVAIAISERPSFAPKSEWRLNYWMEREPEKHLSIVDQLTFAENELGRFLRKPKEHFELYQQEISEISDERRLLYIRDGVNKLEDDLLMSESDIEELGARIEKYREAKLKRGRKAKARFHNEKIVDYWKDKEEFLGLGLSSEEAARRCWRCRSQQDIQHCHIIPRALGGRYIESNLVLLCGRCHAEGPNLVDEKIMFDWIGAYRKRYGDDFWLSAAMDEYTRMYGKTLKEEVEDILQEKEIAMDIDDALSELNLIANEMSTFASVHFGQTWLNSSTLAGCFRLALNKLPAHLSEL